MFLHFHHGFLVVFALAILILLWSFWPSPVVIILFVSSFTCRGPAWLGFFDLAFFLWSCFFIFPFLSFQFLLLLLFLVLSFFHFFLPFFAVLFFCLVLLFVSFQSILAIFWCAICVTVIINLSVILSTLHLCYSYPCFLYSLGWCRPDVACTVLCLCCRSVV